MTQHNPYAPSKATLNARDKAGSGSGQNVWRDGKWLVMDRNASLPHRCVKCNAPAEEPTKPRKLYWHHPAIYLLILFQIIIYLIVALITRKQIEVQPGLCAEHKGKRRAALYVMLCGFAASILLPVATSYTVDDADAIGWTVLLSVLMFLGFAIYGIYAARIVYAKRIDDDEARLGGCGEEYLASLQDYR
jgi:hypothetical protein